MKLSTAVLTLLLISSAFALSLESGKEIACKEIENQEFETRSICLEKIKLYKESRPSYEFFLYDSVTDCAAFAKVSKRFKKAQVSNGCF
jgi:hypothetical protein